LVMFTSDKKRMGRFASPIWLQVVAYVVCVAITALNVNLLRTTVPMFVLAPIAVGGLLFAAWVVFGYKGKAPVEGDEAETPDAA
jgi:manganese transport protein